MLFSHTLTLVPVQPVSRDNFGLLIAYLLPGFVALSGLSLVSDTVRAWLQVTPSEAPTVGGFLYVTLASIAVGLIVSAVRWAVIDHLYHRTGIHAPIWNFRKLPERLQAFETLVQYHYRYYQFHANMLVALSFTYALLVVAGRFEEAASAWFHVGFLATLVILVAGSRDTLRKYYDRVSHLLESYKA